MTQGPQTTGNQAPRWWEVVGGVNNAIQASHVIVLLMVALIGFAWHVESKLDQHDMQFQQSVQDRQDDRRKISDLSADMQYVKINMVTRSDIKDLMDELRRSREDKR